MKIHNDQLGLWIKSSFPNPFNFIVSKSVELSIWGLEISSIDLELNETVQWTLVSNLRISSKNFWGNLYLFIFDNWLDSSLGYSYICWHRRRGKVNPNNNNHRSVSGSFNCILKFELISVDDSKYWMDNIEEIQICVQLLPMKTLFWFDYFIKSRNTLMLS